MGSFIVTQHANLSEATELILSEIIQNYLFILYFAQTKKFI